MGHRGGRLELDVDLRRVVRIAFFAGLPAIFLLLLLVTAIRLEAFVTDFRESSWPAGRSVLDGTFDYEVLFTMSTSFVYPPLTAALFAPIAALPVGVAEGIYTALAIVCVPLGLRALGVRDWRCYGVAFFWPPVLAAVQAGNLSLLLFGGLGLIWALRSRALALGLAVAMVISAKLFLGPVALWLLLTRRFRAAVWTVFFFVTLNVVAWVAIGAGSLRTYIDLLQLHTQQQELDAYTLKALAARLGLAPTIGTAVTWLAVAALLAVWWKWWQGDDRATFSVMVLVALVISPIVWLHYLVLLLVPIALMRPSLSWIWFVPVVSIFAPGHKNGTPAQTALAVGLIAAVAILTVGRREARPAVASIFRSFPRPRVLEARAGGGRERLG